MEDPPIPLPTDISLADVRKFLQAQTNVTTEIAGEMVQSTLDIISRAAANPGSIPGQELEESQISMAHVEEALTQLGGGDKMRVQALRMMFERACAGMAQVKDMQADIHMALLEREMADAPAKAEVYVVIAKVAGLKKPMVIESRATDAVEALQQAEPEIAKLLTQWEVPPESCRVVSVQRAGDDQRAVANVLTTLARAFNEGIGPNVDFELHAGVVPPDYFVLRVGEAKLHIRRDAAVVNVWVVDDQGNKVW